jgi:hypothetical protein
MPQDETASSSLACNICNERRVESEEVVAKIEKVFDLSGESTYIQMTISSSRFGHHGNGDLFAKWHISNHLTTPKKFCLRFPLLSTTFTCLLLSQSVGCEILVIHKTRRKPEQGNCS